MLLIFDGQIWDFLSNAKQYFKQYFFQQYYYLKNSYVWRSFL